MEQQGALLYCGCGHKIWSEVWPKGDYWAMFVFFDDEEMSETYTERVTCCPGCGKQLGEGIFSTSGVINFRQN